MDGLLRLRLKNDGTFRLFQDFEEDDDFVGGTMYDIDKITIPEEIIFNNIKYSINKSEINFKAFDKELSSRYYTYLEFSDFAMVPNLKQLKNCISAGVDELGNRLVLTIFGNFILENDFMKISKPFVALKNEYFFANNGYVGEKAANDDHLMKSLLATGLVQYKKFLETGITENFRDLFDSVIGIQSDQIIIDEKLKAIK